MQVDAMEIDTLLPPSYEIDYHPDYDTANGTFSWSDTTLKFNISNNDLLNIEKRRYWELSFTLVDLDWGSCWPLPRSWFYTTNGRGTDMESIYLEYAR